MKRFLIVFVACYSLFLLQGCTFIESTNDDDRCVSDSECSGDDACFEGRCSGSNRDRRGSGDTGSDSDSDDDEPECSTDEDCGPGLYCDEKRECEDH